MTYYHLRHIETGGECFVQSLNGYDVKDWTITTLPRQPGPNDKLVAGVLQEDPTVKAKSESAARFVNMRPEDLMALLDDMTARLVKLEKKVGP